MTGHALDLSALIGPLMLIDIVDINATVLLDLVQYKIEAGADVRTTLIQDEAHAGARVAHRYKHRCLQTCGDARADRG